MKNYKKVRSIFFVAILIGSGAACAENEKNNFNYGNISVMFAEVRSEPSSNSKLVGYLPGPTGVILDVSSEKNGWIRVSVNWDYKGKAWVKRKNAVFKNDFVKYELFEIQG